MCEPTSKQTMPIGSMGSLYIYLHENLRNRPFMDRLVCIPVFVPFILCASSFLGKCYVKARFGQQLHMLKLFLGSKKPFQQQIWLFCGISFCGQVQGAKITSNWCYPGAIQHVVFTSEGVAFLQVENRRCFFGPCPNNGTNGGNSMKVKKKT